MSGNIAVDPDKLEQLANDVVTELTDMENKYKDLHVELGQMILQCDPRYSSCFSGVGDAWSSGKALVTKLVTMRFSSEKQAINLWNKMIFCESSTMPTTNTVR